MRKNIFFKFKKHTLQLFIVCFCVYMFMFNELCNCYSHKFFNFPITTFHLSVHVQFLVEVTASAFECLS